MKNRIPQNYFIGSLIFHIVIFLVLAISLRDNNQKSFIVFGAHSKKTTKIVFKSPKSNNKKSVSVGSKNIKNIKKKPEKKPDKKPEKKLENKLEKKSGKKSEKKPDKKLEKIKEKSDGDDINIGKLSKKQKKQKEQEKKEQDLKEQKAQKKREQEEREKELEQEREEELQKKKDLERAQKLAAQEEDLLEDFDDQDDESDDQDEKDEPEEFNFLTLSDQEQAIYHKKIQEEVQKLWRPPLGAPRGTKCVVSFVVGPDGTIESFEIVKRSNMLIYDLSIQRVAMKFKFDKSLWGKKFRIDFQQ